ncbi:MAG: helix-turn-helix transcriptional regulator [Lachnospiraceae bacterium]|nr:helix-turn-helix transcriptional regulator [Lachnospiraceae bacterium]
MKKNEFLVYNDLIGRLYSCCTAEELLPRFLLPLKMLIPYSYASIFLANPENNSNSSDMSDMLNPDPICSPDSFREAELQYLKHISEDRTLWLIQSNDASLVRESDLFSPQERQSGPMYENCYRKFNVDDIMHLTVVYNQKFLGIISLFRRKDEDCFSNDDVFILRALGEHLNAVFYKILSTVSLSKENTGNLPELKETFSLTDREYQIVERTFRFQTPEEIAEEMDIRPNTLQKHLQNIFRKMQVTSRWELLKYRGQD